jgi:hypothetical protein
MEFRLLESILKLIFKKSPPWSNLPSSNPEPRPASRVSPPPRSTSRSTQPLRRPLKLKLRRRLTPNLASSEEAFESNDLLEEAKFGVSLLLSLSFNGLLNG